MRYSPVMEMFKVTKQWIEDNSTDNCGFTYSQIEALGETPTKGWKKRSIGKMISMDNKNKFEHPMYKKKGKLIPKEMYKRKTRTPQ